MTQTDTRTVLPAGIGSPFRFVAQASDGRWYPSFKRTPEAAVRDVDARLLARKPRKS